MVSGRSMAFAAAAVAAAGAALISYGVLGTKDNTMSLKPDDARVVSAGAKVYQANCAVCHGTRLEGQPNWRERNAGGLLPAPPHDASGHTWHHPDDVLFRVTKHGVAKVAKMKDYTTAMPVYEGALSDEEIVAVLSWIKAQWPPEIRERQEQIDRQYRKSRP